MSAVQSGINTDECQALPAFSPAKGLSYFCSHCSKVLGFFLRSVQMDLKTVSLLLTQEEISNLLNYGVAENRFCVVNLISGIVKISSLNNKR